MSRRRANEKPKHRVPPAAPGRPGAWSRMAGPLALAVLFVVLVAWSWRRWGDVVIDFGHELYIPWQLAEGRVLYRDIAYFMGPLSQYFNAALFAVFGVSLTTLIVANLAILAGITAAIYALFARALGRAAGTLVAAVFLCVFAFGHYNRTGNYNYVTPYLHEQTHGVALAVLVVLLLARASRRRSTASTAAAGLALGLAFLTKAEAFVPALACAAVAALLSYARQRPPWKRAAGIGGIFVASALVPVLTALAFLAVQMPTADALRGLAGNWIYLFDRTLVLTDAYYASAIGLSEPMGRLREILGATACLLAFVLVALALERGLRGRGRGACVAAGVIVGVALAVTTDYMTWSRSARVLPLVCLGAAGLFVWRAWRGGAEEPFQGDVLLALWSVLSFVSLGKMILRARIEHYGFALAMPGVLLVVALMVFVVPRWLRARGDIGEAWQAAAVAALVVGAGWMLRVSDLHYRIKTVPVGSGGDLLHAMPPRIHPDGAHFAAALETLQSAMRPDDTLAVFPDGALLNYLLRRPNPTPYTLMTPWEMRAFGGEEAVFARMAADLPDYFVLANVDMSEYGPKYFGFDAQYGLRTRLWLEQNYELLADIGEKDETERAWLRIYRRPEGRLAGRLPEAGF